MEECYSNDLESQRLIKTLYVDLRLVFVFLGLYGNDGLLPARWQLRYTGKPLGEQLLSSPTLLWLGPRLGLDTQTAMELLCLAGAVLSLAAMLVEALRDSLVFFCLWAFYLSMYQVGLSGVDCTVFSFAGLPSWCPISHWTFFVSGFRWARCFSTSSGE